MLLSCKVLKWGVGEKAEICFNDCRINNLV